MRAPWRESKQRIMHVLASVSNILCVCVLSIIWLIIWVWACICKTTSHDLSMLNYPEDSIQKDRYSVQTPKNKRVKLWIQHSRCLVSVYMCVWVEINQSMLSHTAGRARARKRALQSTCDGSGSQHGGRLMPALWSRANIPSLIRYKQLLPFCLLSREN